MQSFDNFSIPDTPFLNHFHMYGLVDNIKTVLIDIAIEKDIFVQNTSKG